MGKVYRYEKLLFELQLEDKIRVNRQLFQELGCRFGLCQQNATAFERKSMEPCQRIAITL